MWNGTWNGIQLLVAREKTLSGGDMEEAGQVFIWGGGGTMEFPLSLHTVPPLKIGIIYIFVL